MIHAFCRTAKKHWALSVILFFGLTPSLSAQEDLSRLVDALQIKYQRLASLSADFTQIYSAPGEKTRRESGRLTLKKPGRMRWDYYSPEPKLYVSDGRVIIEYVPSERFATRTKVKEASDMRAPFMFLLGRGDMRRDFSRIETLREAPARAGNRVLKFVPKRAGEFRELIVEIEPASLRIDRLTIMDASGGRSDFIFANLKENLPVSDSQFVFRPPAGVQVIDGS